jgi:hypothetical protein
VKRTVVVILVGILTISMSAVALADDVDEESPRDASISEAQEHKAKILAAYYVGPDGDADAATEEVVELRTGPPAIGWGALFKLMQLAKAKDVPIAELLADMDPEEGWGFGHMFKDLTPEERGRLEGTAKNFGQLKKEAKSETGHPGKGPKHKG